MQTFTGLVMQTFISYKNKNRSIACVNVISLENVLGSF